jgi:hypothetical protein
VVDVVFSRGGSDLLAMHYTSARSFTGTRYRRAMSWLAGWFVAHSSTRRVWIAFGVMLVVQLLGVMARLDADVGRVLAFMPDVQPGYDGQGLVLLIGKLAETRAATLILYGLDMLNPTTGAAFFLLLIGRLLVVTHREESWLRYGILPLLLGVGLDIIENSMVLGLVSMAPDPIIATVHPVLNTITVSKFAAFGIGFVALLSLSFSWALQRLR